MVWHSLMAKVMTRKEILDHIGSGIRKYGEIHEWNQREIDNMVDEGVVYWCNNEFLQVKYERSHKCIR